MAIIPLFLLSALNCAVLVYLIAKKRFPLLLPLLVIAALVMYGAMLSTRAGQNAIVVVFLVIAHNLLILGTGMIGIIWILFWGNDNDEDNGGNGDDGDDPPPSPLDWRDFDHLRSNWTGNIRK